MAGSIEYLTPDNDADHWDMIEGQGSLFHVSYSGVTMALIHGGQPDALILCHEPTRSHMRGLPGYSLPTLEAAARHRAAAGAGGQSGLQVVGISVNTQHMSEDDARAYLAESRSAWICPRPTPTASARASWWTRWRRCDCACRRGWLGRELSI